MAKKKKYIPNVVNPVLESGKHWESCAFDLKGGHRGEDLISRGPDDKNASPCYIIAIEKGKVYKTGRSAKAGYYVYIKHANGYYSAYMHLKKGSILVKTNQLVAKGQRIGYMGDTGETTGIHLHLAIMPNLKSYVDPYPYLIGEKNFDIMWTTGDYITLKKKYIRTSAKVSANNYVKVKECKPKVKPKLTSENPNAKARFKVGVQITVTGFATDGDGNLWGKMDNSYICVKDKTGNQVRKI